jgi:AcrR family transcriptional regulator
MRNEKVAKPVSCDEVVFHRNSDDTRRRILCAAAVGFSEKGYDGLGLREIAADAGVTAAMINRYFGSKEKLFRTIAADVIKLRYEKRFVFEEFCGEVSKYVMSQKLLEFDYARLDPSMFCLRSVGSRTAVPIVAEAFHRGFLLPLAKEIGGKDAELKVAMISSCIIGSVILRDMMRSPVFAGRNSRKLTKMLGNAIKNCR